jgi:hypothetical protein
VALLKFGGYKTLGRTNRCAATTDPRIVKTVIEGLNGWRRGEEKIYNNRFSAEQVADKQTELGWKHFFEGRLHNQWRKLQESYHLQMSIRRSGKRWSGAIIKKLWDIAWDLWEHRNGILHGKECAILSDATDKKVKELWEDPDQTKLLNVLFLMWVIARGATINMIRKKEERTR